LPKIEHLSKVIFVLFHTFFMIRLVSMNASCKMSGYPTKLIERELAEEEVALGKYASTNQARAEYYARAAEHLRLAKAAEEFGSKIGFSSSPAHRAVLNPPPRIEKAAKRCSDG
jgi:hypothetical protein